MDLLRETPLIGRHQEQKALLAPFGGWNMPIQYEGGILSEHRWCREKAALFDICHMGEFLYRGDMVDGGLEDVFTFSVASIPEGRSRYGFLLNEQGGVIDDMIVFQRRLKQRHGLQVLAVSNEGRELSEYRARAFDLQGLIDAFVCSGFVHVRKPDADMFRIALDRDLHEAHVQDALVQVGHEVARDAVQLLADMLRYRAQDRPGSREVASRCEDLARAVPGLSWP